MASHLLTSLFCCSPLATPATILSTLGRGHLESLACCPVSTCCGCTPCNRTCNRTSVALVTGANRGVGYHTAKILLNQGLTVYLLCRDLESGQRAAKKLAAATGNQSVEAFHVDLSDLTTVTKFLREIHQRQTKVVSLVNNAGMIGLEAMSINHLGHFALTVGLIPALKRGATTAKRACFLQRGTSNIVNVASVAHLQGATTIRNEVASLLDMSRCEKTWHPRSGDAWEKYSTSKSANVLFTHALSNKFPHSSSNLRVSSYAPGVMASDLWIEGIVARNHNKTSRECCRLAMSPCVKHPCMSAAGVSSLANPRVSQGCCSCCRPLCDPFCVAINGSGGGYYQQVAQVAVCPVRPMPNVYDMKLQNNLWEASMAQVKRVDQDLGVMLDQVVFVEEHNSSSSSGREDGGGWMREHCWMSPALPCTEIVACLPYCICISCLF